MEETPLFSELYSKDRDSTSLEFYFLNYVLKIDEKNPQVWLQWGLQTRKGSAKWLLVKHCFFSISD